MASTQTPLGYLSNVRVQNVNDKQILQYNAPSLCWKNENTQSLDVAVHSTGTGPYVSGDGTVEKPLLFEWPFIATGDILTWKNDALFVLPIAPADHYVLTSGGGLPYWALPLPVNNRFYVFPDLTNSVVHAPTTTWTMLNATNTTPNEYYYLGGGFISDPSTTMTIIPADGYYCFTANVFWLPPTTVNTGATALTVIGSFPAAPANPVYYGTMETDYSNTTQNTRHCVSTGMRFFYANEQIQVGVYQDVGATETIRLVNYNGYRVA